MRSDYYIDEKGIFSAESSSYPDAVWNTYKVIFGEEDTAEQFERFVQRVLAEGATQRSRQLFSILREGSR